MSYIPYGKQEITDEDLDSVVSCLRSSWITQGPAVEAFEKCVADYCHAKYALATCNATAALHLCCLSLDIGVGDIVWTAPISFVASANCALYCNAEIDFVDICPDTYNLSLGLLEEKLKSARKKNKLPKAVIFVHFAGQSCDMKQAKALSEEYGFKIIEDASHAIGGKYLDQPIGGCQYADLTVFSFHPVKIITTGEGGMVTTNDDDLSRKLSMLRSHGITRDDQYMVGKTEGDWYYQQVYLGFNYRITDIQCALGLSQMSRLDNYIECRHRLAKKYMAELKHLPLILPYQDQKCYSALHLFPIQVDMNKTNTSRKDLFDALRKNNIGVNVHYIPIHLQPYYQKLGFKKGMFPASENYYSNAISIPMFSSLSDESQDYVIKKIGEFF